MSAVWAPVSIGDERPVSPRASQLRAVSTPASRMSRAPFLLVLIGVFGLGMAGLLMLNTTLQNQAFAARALDRQATELAYTQADLANQIDLVSAPPELARRASALGMRPNPYPALLQLPDGSVIGRATPVSGTEVPSMVVKTPAEIATDRAAAKARAEAAAAKKVAEAKAAKKQAELDAAQRKATEKVARQRAAKAAQQKTATGKSATGKTDKVAGAKTGQGQG